MVETTEGLAFAVPNSEALFTVAAVHFSYPQKQMAEPKPEDIDPDFSSQLQALFVEAEQKMEGARADLELDDDSEELSILPLAKEVSGKEIRPSPASSVEEVLSSGIRPIVKSMEALTKAQNAQSTALARMEKSTPEQLPQLFADVRQAIDQKNAVNKAMFDALYVELKGYKDAFILEVAVRPVIRDLISLFDDVTEIKRQMLSALGTEGAGGGEGAAPLLESFRHIATHVDHNLHFILEVLERLEVTQMPAGEGTLDRQVQRAVAVEKAENPGEDQSIVKINKCGFLWKERVIRPEEVVIKKWKDETAPAAPEA